MVVYKLKTGWSSTMTCSNDLILSRCVSWYIMAKSGMCWVFKSGPQVHSPSTVQLPVPFSHPKANVAIHHASYRFIFPEQPRGNSIWSWCPPTHSKQACYCLTIGLNSDSSNPPPPVPNLRIQLYWMPFMWITIISLLWVCIRSLNNFLLFNSHSVDYIFIVSFHTVLLRVHLPDDPGVETGPSGWILCHWNTWTVRLIP